MSDGGAVTSVLERCIHGARVFQAAVGIVEATCRRSDFQGPVGGLWKSA